MKNGIIIWGVNGSGKTTLGKALLVVFMVLMLASCNYAKDNSVDCSDVAMNSRMPFYKTDDAIYYCKIENGVYSIFEQKNNETVNCISTMSEYEYITSIYADGEYIYNNVIDDSDVLKLTRKNIATGEENVLFEDNKKGLAQWDDYIYTDNDTVYYFMPREGLWVYKDGEVSHYLQGAYDCVITDDGIYYSDSNGISGFDVTTRAVTKICTKENVFDSFEDDRMLNILGYGGGYITNLLYRDSELYFLLTDDVSGGIFKLTQGLEKLERVMPDAYANRFNFDNDKLYFYGRSKEYEKRALYEIDLSGNIRKIDDCGMSGFYVKGGLYYYSDDNQLHIVPIEE